MKTVLIFLSVNILTLSACSFKSEKRYSKREISKLEVKKEVHLTLDDIVVKKDFLYDQHTLGDVYPYKDTTRRFQWNKIREGLFLLDSIQTKPVVWAVLQNYKNENSKAPLPENQRTNEYNHITDNFGIQRDQSIPLFLSGDTILAQRYGEDGSLVQFLKDSADFVRVATVHFPGEWLVPKKYVKIINDTVILRKAIFVDRTNQNITTLEKVNSTWLVRSMNPATTGLHKPPYKYETPLGIFVIQEKTPRMIYLADGSYDVGGFAPYASRFSDGAYLHGVPIDEPHTRQVEFSSVLGTTPHSHMCVRNATSHAKFIYSWALVDQAVVFVFD